MRNLPPKCTPKHFFSNKPAHACQPSGRRHRAQGDKCSEQGERPDAATVYLMKHVKPIHTTMSLERSLLRGNRATGLTARKVQWSSLRVAPALPLHGHAIW